VKGNVAGRVPTHVWDELPFGSLGDESAETATAGGFDGVRRCAELEVLGGDMARSLSGSEAATRSSAEPRNRGTAYPRIVTTEGLPSGSCVLRSST
jgi:hypothetical protein